jgi:RHS repeat-associated protein
LVETKLVDVKKPVVGNPLPVIRYQLDNHLGSASLELDRAGQVISYEEYYPYGSTSYQARSVADVSLKRYRYTGMERDEETGLAYHGARYYAAWLGRWCSCDPIGIKDGLNIYSYVRGNPILRKDLTGTVGTCNSAVASCNEPNATINTESVNNRSSETDRAIDQVNNDNTVPFQALNDKKASLPKFDAPKWRKDVDAKLQQREKERVIFAGIKVVGLEEEARQVKEAKVERELPGFVGSLVPVVGPARSSYVHFSNGNYFSGTAYAALAISDLFLVGSIWKAGAKLVGKGVARATAIEAAENIAKNQAISMGSGSNGLIHLTNPAAAKIIAESGQLGGQWGLFALDAGKVPSSQFGRVAATLVPGSLSGEIKIGAEAAQVFASPPRFGLFSVARYYAGVRVSPLGSLSLQTGEFVGGEIFKGGAFRMATKSEYALQLSHQWLLDYGVDALMYSGAKGGLWTHDLTTGNAPPKIW